MGGIVAARGAARKTRVRISLIPRRHGPRDPARAYHPRMDRLAAVELYLRVVETGSFSKAAAGLGITQPTATKAVAALEARLGARLLHRSTRGISPTELGALYYERCKLVAQSLDDADQVVAAQQHGVAGQLRVSCSVAFGRRVLVPLALSWMREHAAVSVDLSFDDRYTDLVAQGVDLAVRMGQMADSSLGARYLGHNPWCMVAAPSYLAAHGAPRDADELATRPCLVYSSVQGDDRWRITPPGGSLQSVPVRGPLRSNNLSAVLAAARAGMGLAILPAYVARDSLAEGAVRPVLADHALPGQEVHAVFPSPKRVPPKVTAFINHLQQALQGAWWERAPG